MSELVRQRSSTNRFCAARSCFNCTKFTKNLPFFSFPEAPRRCRQWLINCGRWDQHCRHSVIAKHQYIICANHFKSSQFYDSVHRDRLLENAVPTEFAFISNQDALKAHNSRNENDRLSETSSNANYAILDKQQDIRIKAEPISPPLSPLPDEYLGSQTSAASEARGASPTPEYILGDTLSDRCSGPKMDNLNSVIVLKQEALDLENEYRLSYTRRKRIATNRYFQRMKTRLAYAFKKGSRDVDYSWDKAKQATSKPNENQFLCEMCGEQMRDFKALEEHQASVQCRVCTDCGRAFPDTDALKAHKLLAHPEGACYACSICNLCFVLLSSLTKHIKREHPCETCGDTFVTVEKRSRHIRRFHET